MIKEMAYFILQCYFAHMSLFQICGQILHFFEVEVYIDVL